MGWLKRWWPVLVWGGLMSFFSTGTFTADNTSHFIIPFLHWLMPHASPDTLELLHYLIRKSAHFTEYFLFSLLVLRGFRAGRPGPNWKWTLWTVLVVIAYASLDEFHQSFVPGRTALPTDVLIDSTGGFVAQIVAWVWMTWRNAHRSRGLAGGAGANATVEGLRD